MTLPRIGITGYVTAMDGEVIPNVGTRTTYADAIVRAGGLALVLPPQASPDAIATILESVDALLLTGGADIASAHYNEEPHPKNDPPQPARDEVEIALVRGALARHLPILGICRGLQVINVALGGTLYQDLPEQYPSAESHHTRKWFAQAHSIIIEADSRLCALIGSTHHMVNSLHHQGINTLGAGVQVVARGPDGVVEGIELVDHREVLAVQYHPEALSATDPASQRLFDALVDAARSYRAQHA